MIKWFRKTDTLESRLFKAIGAGNSEEVRTLLGEHPDLNLTFYCWDCGNKVGLLSPSEIEDFHKGIRDKWSRSDGMYATYHQRTPTELTDLFLRANKDAVYRDILEYLVAFGYPPPYGYLQEDLEKAVQSNDIIGVETLLRKKANINFKGIDGNTPIMLAIKNGNFPIVKLLIENGSYKEGKTVTYEKKVWKEYDNYQPFDDVHGYEETYTYGGYTLLMLAVELSNSEIAKYMIDIGADVNAKDSRGETVLMKAERKQMPEIVSLLKTKGAEQVYRSDADLEDDRFCANELWETLLPPIDRMEKALERGDRFLAAMWYHQINRVSFDEGKQAIDKMILDKKPV